MTSSPKSSKKLSNAKYLFRSLQMNPAIQSSTIIEYRSQLLGFETKNSAGEANHEQLRRRNAVQGRIDELRKQFWLTPVSRLQTGLRSLNTEKFPDLKIAVDRLTKVSILRREIEEFAQDPKSQINLVNTFKRIVMLPPREAGKLKEKYLRNLSMNESADKIKSTVVLLKKNHPDLYALESDWFDELRRFKKRAASESDDGYGWEFEIPGWVIWVLVMTILRILLMAARI